MRLDADEERHADASDFATLRDDDDEVLTSAVQMIFFDAR